MLLEYVAHECEQSGIRILLIPEKTVRYPGTDQPYLGYFIVDPDQKHAALCCAMRNDAWEEVLLHEFNHSRQWVECSSAWSAPLLSIEEASRYGLNPGQETLDVIHLWLDSRLSIEPVELSGLFDRSIAVELDCEQRTAKMGPDLIQGFDRDFYVKKCNAYLRAYKYAELTGVWPDSEASEVLDCMPEEFSLDYFSPITEIEKLAFDASLVVESLDCGVEPQDERHSLG